jgi:Flp pilus assembly protein TadG
MLMPAAVLVFLVLGALCVDFGGVFVAQQELNHAAAAAANDAATQAIDLPHLYDTGEVRLVEDVARRIAERSIAAKSLDRLHAHVEDVQVTGDGTRVLVIVAGRSDYLFAKAVPGGRDHADIRSSSEAEAADIGP